MKSVYYLLLHIVEVDPVEIGEHLIDLIVVQEHSPSRLSQVIQGRVSSERLSERRHGRQLDLHHFLGAIVHGRGQPRFQAFGEIPYRLRQRT